MKLYVFLTVIGSVLGFVVSNFIWSGDDAGNEYTPEWEVVVWFLLVAAGIATAAVKRLFWFSGFLFAFFIPVIGMAVCMFIVRFIRKKIEREI